MRKKSPRAQLAHNVERLMSMTPDLDSADKLAKRCYWTEGKRKGKRVSPRTIRYVLDPRDDAPSPALDLIVAIAIALGREPWELLVDEEQTRRNILARILHVEPLTLREDPHAFVPTPRTDKP